MVSLKRHEVSDSNLRKVSISTANLLLLKKGDQYSLAPMMADFVRSIRNKYRVYLLTRLDGSIEQ